jgi:transposase-like protein
MLLKVCTQCSREEERIKNGDLERNPGYMCPGCNIDIEDAIRGIQRTEKPVKADKELAYYYDEVLSNSSEEDKGTEYDGADE